MIGLRFNKSRFFFDKQYVLDKVDAETRSRLGTAGSHIRQNARRSMRLRLKSSEPGTPPSAHSKAHQEKLNRARRGPLLKDKLFYAYDEPNNSVVIGPEALFGSKYMVPELHEYGGTVTLKKLIDPPQKKRKKKATPKQKAALQRLRLLGRLRAQPKRFKYVQAVYKPRPYMGPALEKERPKLAGVFGDSIR